MLSLLALRCKKPFPPFPFFPLTFFPLAFLPLLRAFVWVVRMLACICGVTEEGSTCQIRGQVYLQWAMGIHAKGLSWWLIMVCFILVYFNVLRLDHSNLYIYIYFLNTYKLKKHQACIRGLLRCFFKAIFFHRAGCDHSRLLYLGPQLVSGQCYSVSFLFVIWLPNCQTWIPTYIYILSCLRTVVLYLLYIHATRKVGAWVGSTDGGAAGKGRLPGNASWP